MTQVDPAEVWLRSEMDNRAFFPDGSSLFQIRDAELGYGSVLTVEGLNLPLGQDQRVTISSTAQSTGMGGSASYNSSSNLPPPAFKSVIPKFSSSSKEPTVNVKVVRATIDAFRAGKADFTPEAQMHLDITESTANVPHVTKEVQQRCGDQYKIVTADELDLEDCEGTRGEYKN